MKDLETILNENVELTEISISEATATEGGFGLIPILILIAVQPAY